MEAKIVLLALTGEDGFKIKLRLQAVCGFLQVQEHKFAPCVKIPGVEAPSG